jgi:hypothetical protein
MKGLSLVTKHMRDFQSGATQQIALYHTDGLNAPILPPFCFVLSSRERHPLNHMTR